MNLASWIALYAMCTLGCTALVGDEIFGWKAPGYQRRTKRLKREGRIVLTFGYGFLWPIWMLWGIAYCFRVLARGLGQIFTTREPTKPSIPKAQAKKADK